MKCSRLLKGGIKCGKETGRPCPPQWIKHKDFDPMVLRIFFDNHLPGITKEDLEALSAFVCPDCMPGYEKYLRRVGRAKRAVTTRKANKEKSDYQI